MTSVSNHLKILLQIVLIGAVFVYLKLGNKLETTPSSISSSRWLPLTEVTEGSQETRESRHLTQYSSSGGNYSNSYETTDISQIVESGQLQQTPNSRQSLLLSPMPETAPPNLPWKKSGLKVTLKSLMKLPWVRELWTFVNIEIDRRFPVAITVSNFNYRSSLVNWLAHALLKIGEKNLLKNVLVLSLDEQLHKFLKRRNFKVLYVPHQSLSTQTDGLINTEISRLVVMRLINFWGYDVVNYDSDAFILKNPQELFDLYPGSHVIGSESYMPFDLHKKWGVTFCMGVVLIRASSESEHLWSEMSKRDVNDDQKKFNFALNSLHVHFNKRDNTSEPWQGGAPVVISDVKSQLNVTVIPMDKICRGQACTFRILKDCFVWHQGGDHSIKKMKKHAMAAKVWLLQNNWLDIDTELNLTRTEWLRMIASG